MRSPVSISAVGKSLAGTRDRFLLALQYQDYRTLWTANACAGAAAWALIVARAWVAFDITDGSSLWVGIVTFMAMVPRLFATPFVGFLADRFDRQTLLSWTYTLNLAHNVALAALVMLGMASPWILVILSLLNGTLRSCQMTTTQSLIPNLVPKEHLLNGIALNQATQQGSRMVGALAIALAPALGFVDIGIAFWVCSGFYAVGLLQVYRIRTRSRGVIEPDRSFFSNLVAGFVYVYRRPTVLAMVLVVLAHCSLTMSYESILPAISTIKLGSESFEGAAFLIAGVGGGALVTSIFLAGIRNETTRGTLFLIFGLTSGLGPIALALSSSWELSIAAVIAMGVNQAGFMTISHAIIQSIVDDGVRGRVSGVYSMHVGGSMAVTNMINGTLADVFTAPAVMIAGGVLFVMVITFSLSNGTMRGIYFPRPAAVATAS